MSVPRFTEDGSAALERHLAETCDRVAAGVRALLPARQFAGLLLGGGYGRGEGGVLRTAAGDQPYNDLEFYVFVHGSLLLAERRWSGALHQLGESLAPAAGLEVEFKLITTGKLQRSETTMFYYDLVLGHRWVAGDESLLAGCDPQRDALRIPLHEATRLLLNRCSGLLFSAVRLQRAAFTPADADFVGRNLAKAQLACGDVWLTACGQYHWSCRERNRRLHAMAGEVSDAVRRHHDAGLEFKLHPVRTTAAQAELVAQHGELVALTQTLWLWLENQRLGQHFARTTDYGLSTVNKCPETSAWRNGLVNLRSGRTVGIRYPRERLLQALALLLWEPNLLANPGALRRVQTDLRTATTSFAELVAAYETLWHRFN